MNKFSEMKFTPRSVVVCKCNAVRTVIKSRGKSGRHGSSRSFYSGSAKSSFSRYCGALMFQGSIDKMVEIRFT